jgi:hypothetical protein
VIYGSVDNFPFQDGSGSMDFDEFCEMMMTKPEGQGD